METITRLNRTTSDAKGDALLIKNGPRKGQPYTRLSLKVESRGDAWISGFDSAATKDWKQGQEVDIAITEVVKDGKTYLNWSLPKKDAAASAEVLEHLVGLKLSVGALRNDVQRILDRLDGKDKPSYPESTGPTAFDESDVNPDDLPF